MTPKQKLFVSEYLKDFNATRAATDAGYSPDTAAEQGSRLLKNVQIREEVKTYVDAALADDAMSLKKRIIDELQRWAFAGDDEISHGIRAKYLELLGKYMALFTEKVEHSGEIKTVILPGDAESL
jgi:phage terminase small subunit